MALVAVGPPKFCPACGFVRPRSDFYGIRHPNGQVYAQSLCIEHTKARVIASHEAEPERVRRNRERYRRRRKTDPERLAAHRAYQREWARKKRDIRPDRFRYDPLQAPVSEPCPTMDTDPFAVWLRTLGDTLREIADASGIHYTQVANYLNGKRPTVTLDVVDRAALHAGQHIDLIYPLDNAA